MLLDLGLLLRSAYESEVRIWGMRFPSRLEWKAVWSSLLLRVQTLAGSQAVPQFHLLDPPKRLDGNLQLKSQNFKGKSNDPRQAMSKMTRIELNHGGFLEQITPKFGDSPRSSKKLSTFSTLTRDSRRISELALFDSTQPESPGEASAMQEIVMFRLPDLTNRLKLVALLVSFTAPFSQQKFTFCRESKCVSVHCPPTHGHMVSAPSCPRSCRPKDFLKDKPATCLPTYPERRKQLCGKSCKEGSNSMEIGVHDLSNSQEPIPTTNRPTTNPSNDSLPLCLFGGENRSNPQ